jgi:hypothetical protein
MEQASELLKPVKEITDGQQEKADADQEELLAKMDAN